MKSLVLAASFATLAFAAVGCSFAARSPEMYRDDTQKLLESKNNDIRACYDAHLKGAQGTGGKVTVKFDVEAESGKIMNVVVDKPNTTAPEPLGDCVKKSIDGLVLNPGDARLGQATFVYDFSQPAAPKS